MKLFAAVAAAALAFPATAGMARAQMDKAERHAEQTMRADCALPKPSAAAKMLLLGTYETEALSSVALATQDMVTNTGSVVIEPGKEPLYIVLTSMQPTIWRFLGATERVERVVVTDSRIRMSKTARDPTPLVGVIGLPPARVTIPQRQISAARFPRALRQDRCRATSLFADEAEQRSGERACILLSRRRSHGRSQEGRRQGLSRAL
jgi:hypothetical protein